MSSLPLMEGWMGEALLTEAWLKDVGFYSSQGERQPHKHWHLKLGWAVDGGRFSVPEDLCIEVSMAWWRNRAGEPVGDTTAWNCWLTGMNNSLLHVRYIRTVVDLTGIISALVGWPWNASCVLHGTLRTPEQAAKLRPANPTTGGE